MTKKKENEKLYHIVEKHLKKNYSKSVLDSATNTGIGRMGHVDVLVITGKFGDLSNTCEVISVEVKPSKYRFLNSIGQALGYSIFSDRCYLAVKEKFDRKEKEIAARLGVGLIKINKNSCTKILDSKLFTPIEDLKLKLLFGYRIQRCSICGSFLPMEDTGRLSTAMKNERDYVYKLKKQRELARKMESGETPYMRRAACVRAPDTDRGEK